MSKAKKIWSSQDRTVYTIAHRKKHEQHCYSFGYVTDDLQMLRDIAENEAQEGSYRCVKIINAETNEDFQYFTKVHK